MESSLLATKLRPSQSPPKLVARPRLAAKLKRDAGRRLTLVSAPAGSGKTILLVEGLKGRAGDEGSVAWVSLDAGDNDPVRFLSYLVAALKSVDADTGGGVMASLLSPQPPAMETIAAVLVNELADLPGEVTVILDDYHVIDSEPVHGIVTFLLDNLPPNAHLVVSSRTDPPLPLSRLRARGQMAELRAADLRFTIEETDAFLAEVMGLELTPGDVAALEGRTEGWIAGLQLAALSMRGLEDVSGFIEAFAGSNRYVLDYLVDEVLQRQPERVTSFLLRSSILDRMSGELCDAVMGEDGGQEMLEMLDGENLFVIPLDEERHWYRYHRLFADVLRNRLQRAEPESVTGLHRRASVWFEQQGSMSEAVRHALAAGRWEHAADLIEGHALPIVLGGQLRTVLGWIDALPDALVRDRSTLSVVQATALVFADQLEAAEARLQHVEELVRHDATDGPSRLVLGQVSQLRAIIARFSGDLKRCVDLARRALELLPETEMLFRSGARLNVARAYQLSGDVGPDNERLASEAVLQTRMSRSLFAVVNSLTNLARLQRLKGRLRAAAATYREIVRAVPGQEGLESLVGGIAYYAGLGDINREWNDLDAAERLLTQGVALARGPLTIDPDAIVEAHLALALVYQARARYADALSRLETPENLVHRNGFPSPFPARVEAARARLALARGDLLAAVRWADASSLKIDGEIEYRRHEEYLALARVRIAQGRDEPTGPFLDDALRLLERCLISAERGARTGSVVEILALRGLGLHAKQDAPGALDALERALALAQPEGYVRTFVDEGAPMAVLLREILKRLGRGNRNLGRRALLAYARGLLAVLESPGATAATPVPLGGCPERTQQLAEPLTKRELEVLRLIAEGLTNREIAARLFIATSTVKWYVNVIFRKLEADNRTRAVARARQTGLLSE